MADVDAYNEDWEKDAPLLNSLKGKQPYDAPEGYFDTLPGSMMARIRDLDQSGGAGRADESGPASLSTEASESGGSNVAPEPVAPGDTLRMGPKIYSIAAVIALLVAVGVYFLVRSVDLSIEGLPNQNAQSATVDASPFDTEELMSQIDFSLVSDEEIVEMMGDEALAAWEVDQLGQGLNLNFDDMDLYQGDSADVEELDDLDLDELDRFDLEGIEDLLYQ